MEISNKSGTIINKNETNDKQQTVTENTNEEQSKHRLTSAKDHFICKQM
jgi:hypothetical protein